MLKTSTVADTINQFAADVRAGLTRDGQKEIPSEYLYDDLGSALFEAITLLPEYGLTQAGERILREYAGEIAALLPDYLVVAELGSGSGKKTRWLLEELGRGRPTLYLPIDISAAAVEQCRKEMEAVPGVSVRGIIGTYLPGLQEAACQRPEGHRMAVLFLGSTLGNFKPEAAGEFLRQVRETLQPEDFLLLATDLVKPVKQLLLAYDDPTGVTAAFNLNLLARINRELDADFDLSQFAHLALWNHAAQRVEMHLVSLADQTITIRAADLTFHLQKDETVWTECSHKFTAAGVARLGEEAGFRCLKQWIDGEWPFAQTLLVAG